MILVVITQSHKKSPFLTFFFLFGKNSNSRIGDTPINQAWMDSSTITASYVDSPNAQLSCAWKRGALTSDSLKININPSKWGANLTFLFRQGSRASLIRFLKFILHFTTVSHQIFAMASSSGGKFGLTLSKRLKKLPFGGVP